jgi:multidrug efflux pump subunit AcrB
LVWVKSLRSSTRTRWLKRLCLPGCIAVAAFALAGLIELWRLRGERRRDVTSPIHDVNAKSWFRRGFDTGFGWVRDNPLRLIVKTAVAWRYVTLALCVSALILIVGVVRGNHVGFVFFPSPEAENITASITFTPGVSEEAALATLARVDEALHATDEQLTANLDDEDTLMLSAYATYGSSGRNRGDNFASIDVELTSSEARSSARPRSSAPGAAPSPICRAWSASRSLSGAVDRPDAIWISACSATMPRR